jgi:tight adherence protein B
MPTNHIILATGGIAVALLIWVVVRQVMALFPSTRDKVEGRLLAGARSGTVSPVVTVLRQRSAAAAARGQSDSATSRFEHRLQLVFPGMSPIRFVAISVVLAAVCAVLMAAIGGWMLALVVGLCVGFAPLFIYSIRRGKRQRVMSDQLVDALDFLARVLRAGHSLATGLKMCGEELPDPIASEFVRCHEHHQLGQTMEESLVRMAERMDLTDFNFFVTSVAIQRQTGGDLAEVLDNIASMIRARIRLQQQVRALTSEGRATGVILTALPVLIFVAMWALNPTYTGILIYTSTGQTLMGITLGLMVLGMVLIRKIVTIKV